LKCWNRKRWIGISKALKKFRTWREPMRWNDFEWQPKRFAEWTERLFGSVRTAANAFLNRPSFN
jgi:hypothetical protein